MDALTIARVDERDSSWENPRPRFRVCLHGSGADSTQGPTDTFDIIGADVLQTIEWAQRQAGDTLTYAVALVYDDMAAEQSNPGHGRGLVWLVGMDGSDTPCDAMEEDRQRRMLLRRATPVTIPTADRMPTHALDPDTDVSTNPDK